jgi:hypothetical protein
MKVPMKTAKLQRTKKSPEYEQGADAQKKFERTMTGLFRVPKDTSKKPKKGKD